MNAWASFTLMHGNKVISQWRSQRVRYHSRPRRSSASIGVLCLSSFLQDIEIDSRADVGHWDSFLISHWRVLTIYIAY